MDFRHPQGSHRRSARDQHGLTRTLRLTVSLALADDLVLPADKQVDADLLELACAIYDHIGGEWSADLLRGVMKTWAPATDH